MIFMTYYNIQKVPSDKQIPNIELEGKYPNNTVFIDDDGNRLYHYKNNTLYYYGQTDKVLGSVDIPSVVMCNDSSCPTGYTEYTLDEDRVLMLGTPGYSGTYSLNYGYPHTHNIAYGYNARASSGLCARRAADIASESANIYLNQYIKFRLCISTVKTYTKNKGVLE